MSLKEKFAKISNKIVNKTSLEEIGNEIESTNLEKALYQDKNRFIPDVDFSNPENFAKFGSAEKYYRDSISSIYSSYPYDGSLYEKTNWHNLSSDITNYIFDNLYPRNNGYINLGANYGSISSTILKYSLTTNPEYILFKGGPNQSTESTLKDKFSKANKLDVSNNRSYNLYLNGETGFTTEFWFKKDTTGSQSENQVIFDLWNSGTISNTSGSPYGRFRIQFSTSSLNSFTVIVRSGSNGTPSSGIPVGTDLNLTSSIWTHYAISVSNSGSSLKVDLYKNGELNFSDSTAGSSIGEVTGAYIATIGSLVTAHQFSATTTLGYGKLSGSLDEFRFWKSKRTDKQINRYWFTQVGAGTNTDESNTDLGVYYKFNEGIYDPISVSAYDQKIIDYSGRISNGQWTGYGIGSRNTGSAIIESQASFIEFKDPVLYSSHPDVASLMEEKTQEGKEHDLENNGAMINSFPQWMLDEDSEQLKNLSQLASEYFDDLYLKIKFLPEIQNASYTSGKPLPFSARLLESHGFTTSDIFTDANVLESLLARTENINYEDKIHNVKNFVYQNIYNNLTHIYRSKGTEKSLRNFIRCFGVDDNLIKINLYANDITYTIEDTYLNMSSKKKYVDFNDTDRFIGTVYQHTTSSISNTLSYIPGSSKIAENGTTFEVEIVVPKKPEIADSYFFPTTFISSSIGGMHSALVSNTNYTWASPDYSDLQIYLVRTEQESKDAYFKLTSSYLGINLTSSVINDIYNEERWNLSVLFYHEKYPYSKQINGADSGNYIVQFSGYNIISDSVSNNFKVTGSVNKTSAEQHLSSNKRIYVGSHRQNFTGSVLCQSDLRISSVKYWISKLSEEALLEHAKDPLNYGHDSPYGNAFNIKDSTFIPFDQTLALHWNFENVTGSDNGTGVGPSNTSDGKFIVRDLTDNIVGKQKFVWLDDIIKYEYIGQGDFFLRNDKAVIKRDFISSLKRKLPETLNSNDMINILQRDDLTFTRDSTPVVHYFTIEKSMYQVISDEIIKSFGIFSSLNNLIGEPVNRYRQNYRTLDRFKDMYFERVQNDIDVEKYIEFYKWFDQSIGDMIEQLIPISANFSPSLKTVIESHILERNKYWNKYPTLELKKEPPIDAVNGINELKYSWKNGHAPIPFQQDISCLWWATRAHASGTLNTANRKEIVDSKLNALNRKFNTMYDFSASPITIIDKHPTRTDFIKGVIKFSGNSYLSIDANNVPEEIDCSDE